MITAQALANSSVKLVSLPDAYVSLRNVLNSPNYSMTDVAMVIGHDPALTARLLKIVNSPFYGLSSRIDTITRAINLLGTRQVHDLAFATTVVNTFSGFTNDIISMYDFWFNSVYCAVTAQLLALRCKSIDTERPFVAGLLHDIGHLVMYQEIPEESRATIALAEEKGIALYKAEREILGFDYAQVGAELMREWALPESLREKVEFHNEPARANIYKLEAGILHIAKVLTKAALAKDPISADTLNIDPVSWEFTELSFDDLPEVRQDADQHSAMAVDLLIGHTKKKSN